MHELLERQIRKSIGSSDSLPEPLDGFLELVNAAYERADVDRERLERAARQEMAIREQVAGRIRESERKYRALFEQSLDPICVVATDGTILDLNKAAVEALEFSSREAAKGFDFRKLYVRVEDRERLLEELAEWGFLEDREIHLKTLKGRRIVVLATSVPLHENGEVVALRSTLRDVTNQRELQRELLEAQKIEAVGRLAGGVAHDFNNLLTAISGSAELLAADLSEGDEREELVEEIREAARRGAELTQRLLAFGRRQVVVEEPLDLNSLVSEVQILLRRLIGDNVELDLSLAEDCPTLLADRSQMEQVIVNLAINARDAMGDSGRIRFATSVVVVDDAPGHSAVPPGEYARLIVSDTGPGIDDEIRAHIFEPFFTTKMDEGGTGLGLATVYGIVQQSNGFVRVSSSPGEGTSFELLWPNLAKGAASLTPKADGESADLHLAPSPSGGEGILVVDDDPSVRRLTSRLLEYHGYRVWSASAGEEALALFAREGSAIDLIVSDVVMPGMQGPELAQRLRELEPELRVVLISGYAESIDDIREREEGRSTYFLHKPFRGTALAGAVRRILDSRGLRDAS